MRRLALIAIVAASASACAGSREVSKLRYTSTDCPDPNGCEAPLGEQEYQLPDESRDPVAVAAAEVPPPSCETVAIALVAIELGNYASEEEERSSLLEKHRAACVTAKLDERETSCMSTVTDVKHVGYCTRKMGAPTQRVPLMSKLECQELGQELRQTLRNYGSENRTPIYEAACVEDGWPVALGTCVKQHAYDPMNQCRDHAPGWVFDQVQARIDGPATAKK